MNKILLAHNIYILLFLHHLLISHPLHNTFNGEKSWFFSPLKVLCKGWEIKRKRKFHPKLCAIHATFSSRDFLLFILAGLLMYAIFSTYFFYATFFSLRHLKQRKRLSAEMNKRLKTSVEVIASSSLLISISQLPLQLLIIHSICIYFIYWIFYIFFLDLKDSCYS